MAVSPIYPLSAAWAVSYMAWAVRGRSSSVFAPSVWHGLRRRKAIALTFDDGPSESTREILEILAKYDARATFFQCGANVERLPEIAHSVVEAGHEIGNHSHTHPYLFLRTPQEILDDLRRAQKAIETHTGARPVLFRAPYGVRWRGLRAAQDHLKLTGVMWTAIGYDWKSTAEDVATRMGAKAENGAILCLHDGRELQPKPDIRATVEAVRTLVPMLQGMGYKLETVSQLLCPKN